MFSLIGIEEIKYAAYGFTALIAWCVILMWPFAGLVAMIALVPGEELTTVFGGKTLTWLLGIAVLFAWAIRYLALEKRINVVRKPTFFAILWLAWSLLSVAWSYDKATALGRTATLAQCIGFYCLLQMLISDNRRLQYIIGSYFISTFLFSIMAIVIHFSEGLRRASLVKSQDPNIIACALGIGFLMAPYLMGRSKSIRWKVAAIISMCFIGFAILLTGSRGTWIGLIAASGLAWMLSRGKIIRLRWILVAIIVVIIGIIWLSHAGILDEWMVSRVRTMFDIEATKGGAGRINIWSVGWEMVKDKPLNGVGLENFPQKFEDYITPSGYGGAYGIYKGRDPHSVFLSIQAELGIVGTLLFLAFIWAIYKELLAIFYDPRATLALLTCAFLFFSAIFITTQYRKFFWLTLGIATVIPRMMSAEESSTKKDYDNDIL